jgi:uncharacterized protein YcaQ
LRKRHCISGAEARRIALAAQGFDRQRPSAEADARHFRRVLDTLGLVQLDFVNVLMPAQFLVFWSRLGAYDRKRLESLLYRRREYTEQWAHEASIVPVGSWPLLDYRRLAHRLHGDSPLRRLPAHSRYLDDVLKCVATSGGLTASDLPQVPGPRRKPGDWHRSIPRRALEFHFARGDLAIAERRSNFQRVYDLAERVIPAEYRCRALPREEARRELLQQAARALGIATLQDLADYYRMTARDAAPRLAELEEEGAVRRIEVDGWNESAYLAAGAHLPREIPGASLLSPFDPVVWFRPRAQRLFGFQYRIEIYTPAAKRRWGYYVLPFRVGDRIEARVDLKADRKAGSLLVPAAYLEKHADAQACADRLAAELRALADWLGLTSIRVARRNEFSRALARVI